MNQVQICNMALSELGVSEAIQALTDNTEPAKQCNLWFTICQNQVLRDFTWPFTKRTVSLVVVTDWVQHPTTPPAEWSYAYRWPSDCYRALRMPNQIGRLETARTRISYKIVSDSNGKLLLTDLQNAQLEYVALVDDPNKWDADFCIALAYLLASHIGKPLTKGDKYKLTERAEQRYLSLIEHARTTALNEEQPDQPVDSAFVTEREGVIAVGDLSQGTQEMYPSGIIIE